jgi:hypothetical protein
MCGPCRDYIGRPSGEANAEMIPMLQVATSCFLCSHLYLNVSKLGSLPVKATKIICFKIVLNQKLKLRAPSHKPLLLAILTRSLSLYSYQTD